jgi:O-antigen/teichoic acid export membrane protein
MRAIFRNTFWLALAEASTRGVSFLVFIWMARHFGPEIYGRWAFALNFVGLFAILTDFGFSALTIRELARDKSKTPHYVGNILAMKMVLGLATAILIVFIIQFLGQEEEVVNLVYFLALYIIINNFATFFHSIFRANEKMYFESVCRVIQGLGLLVLSAFFIISDKPILNVSYAYVTAALIGASLSLIFVWHYFSKFFLEINWNICREILEKAWPFLFSGIFYMVYFSINSVILGMFSVMKQVGYYNAAYSLFAAVFVLPGIITMSFYPKLSDFYEKDTLKFKKVFFNFRKILIAIGLPLTVILFFLSKPIIIRIYSLEYSNSIIILKILSVVILFKFLTYVYGWFLTSANEQKKVLIVQISGTLLSIIISYFLIIRYDALGAAVATAITELFLLMLYFFFFRIKWNQLSA